MAEVGLVPFAHLALQVAAPGLPPYRTRFSKHQFTQPQLLAVLWLMRYEDWTYREVEVRLREHSELRRALGLRRVPDHTTLYRFLRRLESGTIEEALGEAARREGRKPSLPGASPGGIPAKPNHPSPRKTPIIDAHSLSDLTEINLPEFFEKLDEPYPGVAMETGIQPPAGFLREE